MPRVQRVQPLRSGRLRGAIPVSLGAATCTDLLPPAGMCMRKVLGWCARSKLVGGLVDPIACGNDRATSTAQRGARSLDAYVTLMQKCRTHCGLHTHAHDLPDRLLDKREAA
eukprot:1734797-Prymnesium_polylepis.1